MKFKSRNDFINTIVSDFFCRIGNERGEVGSGDGNGDGDGNGAAGDVQQQLTQLQSQLESLKGETEKLREEKSNLEQRLSEVDEELLSDDFLEFKSSKSKAKPSNGGDDLGIDLDTASNREIAEFIESKYKGDLESAVGAIRKELDLSKQQLGMIAAQFDVALTTMRHNGQDGKPSFAEHQKEIFEIAKANPTWDAERCYQQFVLENKVRLEEEEEKKRKKAEEEAKAATERAGVPFSAVKSKNLSDVEAADLAYRKAFGAIE